MPDVTLGAVFLQLKALEHMWNDALWNLKLAAELEESRRGPRPARRRRGAPAKTRTPKPRSTRKKDRP